jgi:hypothetical protein
MSPPKVLVNASQRESARPSHEIPRNLVALLNGTDLEPIGDVPTRSIARSFD